MQSADECWVPPGRTINAGQWVIPGGMVYVGSGLAAGTPSYRAEREPALLDPRLPVEPPGTSPHADLPYWPSYERLSPEHRSAVLDWLAGGRQDPDVDLGVVFVFFYGLERRLLVDAVRDQSAAARAEAPAIVAEIERLRPIYGDNASFSRYSAQLLLFAQMTVLDGRLKLTIEPKPDVDGADPRLAVALGHLSENGEPIPWNLALSWYLVSDEKRLRTPGYRCWEKLAELFEKRYRAKFGEGMTVKPNKTRLRIPYVPASPGLAGLSGRIDIPVGDYPDVMRLKRPVRKIAEIVESCMTDLDAYSRWLGRSSGDADGLRAAALLPPELVEGSANAEAESFQRELDDLVDGDGPTVVRADLFFEHWSAEKGERMSKREATGLVHLLERLGYGLEPDPRFGGKPLQRGAPAVIFRLTSGAHLGAPSDEYAGAMLLLHLAALVAAADGTMDRSEELAIERHLENALDLSPAERLRLLAHTRWLVEVGPRFAGLKKRLEQLDAETRQMVADLAVSIANADGHIDPNEIKVLRRIYSMLGLDPEDVYGAVHSAAAAGPAREPVTVRSARAGSSGHAIPAPPRVGSNGAGREAGGPALDMDRLRKKLQETAHVSAMLSEIFEDDEDEQPPPASAPAGDKDCVEGLDAGQTAFLQTLPEREEWSQAELEALAERHGVLLEGTVDAINDLAFERLDEPALEWDEPVAVDVSVVKELIA